MRYRFERVPAVHAPKAHMGDRIAPRVEELAAEGWRLVQVLVENPASVPSEYLLILERQTPP